MSHNLRYQLIQYKEALLALTIIKHNSFLQYYINMGNSAFLCTVEIVPFGKNIENSLLCSNFYNDIYDLT